MAQPKGTHGKMATELIVAIVIMTALYWPYEFVLWLVHQ